MNGCQLTEENFRVPEFHCSTLKDLHQHIEAFTKSVGFQSFGFAAELRQSEVAGFERLHFVTNAAPSWRESIKSAVLAGEHHNMVRHCSLHLPPLGWSSSGHLVGHTIVDELARSHVLKMRDWRVEAGSLCPVSAPELEWGGIGFFSTAPMSFATLDKVVPICSLYALNFCFWYMQIAIRRQRENRSILTQRESECLQYAAQGKTSAEIGMILSISSRTVEGYIGTACTKLNTRGRQAAISKATEMNLIGGRNSLKEEFARQRDNASHVQIASETTPLD